MKDGARAATLLGFLLAPGGCLGAQGAVPTPPPTRQDNVREVLHGVEIVDPYRWLEDQASPETRAWIEAQNRYTLGVLDGTPWRGAIVSPHVVLGSPVRFLSLCTRAGVREKVSECETGS